MTVPLLLDTDIGDDVDDVFALLLAGLTPHLSLVGVTTVYGDTAQRSRIARKFLDLIGHPDIPVATGHQCTLSGRDPGEAMASGWVFVTPRGGQEWEALGARLVAQPAVDFLIDTILQAPEPPVLAAIGPLTNLGEVFRRAPELARRVRSVVLMGGRLGPEAARGEHNFNCDPEATQIVLSSGAPLVIGTVEVTVEARLDRTHQARLRAGPPACQAAAVHLEQYPRFRERGATSMYDPLSLTLAYTGRYLTMQPVALSAVRSDVGIRLEVVDGAPPTASVSVGLDAPAFIEHMLTTLGA